MFSTLGVEAGNPCLFYTFGVFNFLVLLQSICLLGISVYLFIFTEEANAFNIGFMIIALLLLAASFFAFQLKRRPDWLMAYLAMLLALFLAQLIFTILIMSNKESILEYAEKNENDSIAELYNKISNNFDGVIISLWVFCGITVIT